VRLEDFKARVFIGTPCYSGEVHYLLTESLLIAQLDCLTRKIFIDWHVAPGFSLVQYSRNYLVKQFLDDKAATHLFWLDSDLGFSPDAIRRLVDRNLDVVCAVYPTKHPHTSIFPFMSCGPVIDGLQEASRVPGGFLMVSRRAVEAVVAQCKYHKLEHDGQTMRVPHVFDLFYDGDDETLLGEDYLFSAKLRNAGFKIFVETDVNLHHMGMHAFSGNLARTMEREEAEGKSAQASPEAQAFNQKKHTREDRKIVKLTTRNKSWETNETA